MVELHTYSVLLNWHDGDREQGTFGALVRAENEEKAEAIARAEMRATHIANYCDDMDDDETTESCAGYEGSDGEFGGSVVELTEGAIWHAAELEVALRGLLDQVDAFARSNGWPDNAPRERARKAIDRIDANAAVEDCANG